MANEEHVARLKRGVEEWNRWRQEKYNEIPDLSDANLSSANLSDADLNHANLHGAKLIDADCRSINLSSAVLSSAKLHRANLTDADLSRTDFHNADLSSAILRNSILYNADLSGAKLICADLSNAMLVEAVLSDAISINANFNSAEINYAKLNKAHLNNAKFVGADLSYADLRYADLRDTDLSDAKLYRATLLAVQALGTDFTAATLTGACIEDWNINPHTNLQDVICEFVFFKYVFSPEKFIDRRPHDPNTIFKPGEFAALVQQSLETVDLIFLDGIDWKAFFQSFQQLQSKYQDDHLNIQAIEKKPDGAFVIRLEVDAQADRAAIELDGKSFYETQLKVLEAQYEERLRLQGAHLEDARKQIEAAHQANANLIGVISTMANSQGNTFNINNSNVANIVGTAQSGSRQQAIQHNYASPEKQSLAEAAAEIQRLLKQLEQTNPTATEEEKTAFVTAGVPATLRQRAVSALQSGGKAAIEEFLDNAYANVAIAAIEGWSTPDV